ncbi:MAG: hypothetical protein J5823_00480 [Paludibacteraceae bacterium]|nr:hypothetical protein [Paludibacteraceae bacterium]
MIDNWLFQYKKKRQPQREVLFPNYSKVRSAVIVFEQNADSKQHAMLIKSLERDGMMVEVVGYEPKKDFTYFGRVREEAMASLPSQRFDLLLDLSTHYYLGTQYIDMAIDATFKAGLRFPEVPEQDQQGILDMMISLTDNPQAEEIAEQVIHFMKMINA